MGGKCRTQMGGKTEEHFNCFPSEWMAVELCTGQVCSFYGTLTTLPPRHAQANVDKLLGPFNVCVFFFAMQMRVGEESSKWKSHSAACLCVYHISTSKSQTNQNVYAYTQVMLIESKFY